MVMWHPQLLKILSLMLFCAYSLSCASTEPAKSPTEPFLPKHTTASTDGNYETLPVFKAAKILKPDALRGPYHHVAEQVPNDGYMNHYSIVSKFGEFSVRGNSLLQTRINEVFILAQLDKVTTSQVFVGAAKKTGKNMVTAPINAVKKVYETVSNPQKMADTVKSIPGGVVRLFDSVADRVGSGYTELTSSGGEEGDRKSVSAYGAQLGNAAGSFAKDYTGYSKARRSWMERLGIDPYTTNDAIQNEIARIAWVETSVGFGANFIVPGLPALPYVSTFNQYKQNADRLALYEDPDALEKRNVEELKAMGGVFEKSAKAFMANKAFSPAARVIIIDHLKSMPEVKNRGAFINLTAQASSEDQARFFQEAAGELAEFHKKVQPLDALVENVLLPAGVTKAGRLMVTLPVDYLVWTDDTADIFLNARERVKAEHAVSSVELHLTGGISPRCRSEMVKLEVGILEQKGK